MEVEEEPVASIQLAHQNHDPSPLPSPPLKPIVGGDYGDARPINHHIPAVSTIPTDLVFTLRETALKPG